MILYHIIDFYSIVILKIDNRDFLLNHSFLSIRYYSIQLLLS
jgi:hypothetical protein